MNPSKAIRFPEMAFVKQRLRKSDLLDILDAISSAVTALPLSNTIHPGQSVAVAVGSRGIDRIGQVTGRCIELLVEMGLKPFIVPAMGSHGGGTDKGQMAMLTGLGVTEATMRVLIYPEMDVTCIDTLPGGLNLYISKKALEADHIVLINRIKPHTKFSAELESGLCKMLTIGLGKAEGAAEFHRFAVQHTFSIIEQAARVLLDRLPVLFGIGLIEDGCGKLAHIEAVLPHELIDREKEMLKNAAEMMGSIPFDHLDLLIIDLFGKDISGIGMDSKVTGRHRDIAGDFFLHPHAKRIFVRDLSPGSDGNGNGIGLADVTTQRLVDGLDLEKTYVNAITAISTEKAAIPMHFATDRQALDVCINTAGLTNSENARIVRIKDTASLEYMQVSKVLEDEVSSHPDLELITSWSAPDFDENDNLMPFSFADASDVNIGST